MAGDEPKQVDRVGAWAPFEFPAFRALWGAVFFSNLGIWSQQVGAGWAMTSLAPSADMVALVQAATSLPPLLLSLLAGALCDLFDRRLVFVVGQSIILLAAFALAVVTYQGWLGPWNLLCLTLVIGVGSAIRQPAFQASIGDLVPRPYLPSAVAVNSLGFNLARSVGPAIGGFLVALGGSAAAFLFNACSNIGIIAVMILQRRSAQSNPLAAAPARAPAASADIWRAMGEGARYFSGDPVMRSIMARVVMFGFGGSATWALLPLIAKHDLQGSSVTLGLLVGALGVGAVLAAAVMPNIRQRVGINKMSAAAWILFAGASFALSFLHRLEWLLPVLVMGGAAWMTVLSTLNTSVQMASPGWVRGRVLSIYLTGLFAGLSIGAWLWGEAAVHIGVPTALFCAGGFLSLGCLATRWLPIPDKFADA